MRSCVLLLAPAVALAADLLLLPETTGDYSVGVTHLEMVDTARIDPFTAGSESRNFMVSIFYPAVTTGPETGSEKLAPQFPPKTAAFVDSLFDVSTGTAARLTTRAVLDAPLVAQLVEKAPVVLFNHGYSVSRAMYTVVVSELASRGFVVVTADFLESPFVEFPDGRTYRPTIPFPADKAGQAAMLQQLLDIRVGDWQFVLSQLASNQTVLDYVRLQTDKVVSIGHSFGGASAVQSLLDMPSVVGTVDLDGALHGDVLTAGTDLPVLLLGAATHLATDDGAESPAWEMLRGCKADFAVHGSVHYSYSDYPVFAQLLPGNNIGPAYLGNVTGTRMTQIMAAYSEAFVSKLVTGVDGIKGLLSSNTTSFPEVVLRQVAGC